MFLFIAACGGDGGTTSQFSDKFYAPNYSSSDAPGTTPADLSTVTSLVINKQSKGEGIAARQTKKGKLNLDDGTVIQLVTISKNPCPSNLSGCDTNDSCDEGICGHAVLAVGYQDDASVDGGGYIIIKNSWGPSWGDGGIGYATYQWVENSILDAQGVVSVGSK